MSGRAHVLKAALEVGFDECLMKPVGREQLVFVVELAQRRQASAEAHVGHDGANSQDNH
jgi:DNA-binding response OmpR family regulator